MTPDTKAAFQRLSAEIEAKAKSARNEQQRQEDALRQFQTECSKIMSDVVVPSLQEIEPLLQEAGFVSNITQTADAVKLVLYRGNMMAVGGAGRPYVEFSAQPGSLKLGIASASLRQGSGRQDYLLSQITDDFVAKQVLTIFERLATE
jgi:hypothetical protein